MAAGLPTPPQATATDAAGADTYTTILTTSSAGAENIYIACSTKNAIVSVDGGTTDHIYVLAGVPVTLNNIKIEPSTAIQAKNAVAGQNYANLYISIW